jgi:cell division protease FtsH
MPVSKITIIPRTGGSLGATMYIPDEEKNLYTREDLIAKIHALLGGRAAEEVVFGTMTTGASNDLQRATGLARDMIARYGMSKELGLLSPTVVTNQYLDGQSSLDCSQEIAATVDKAARSLLESCYEENKKLLSENRGLLDEISEYLLTKETITGEELMAYVNAAKHPSEEA